MSLGLIKVINCCFVCVGLFHRSISMSASPLCPWSFYTSENAEKQAFALGEKLGVSAKDKNELLKILYEMPAFKLIEVTEELVSVKSISYYEFPIKIKLKIYLYI